MAELDDLLPHRPPMRLIDRVVAVGEEHAVAEATIAPGMPFCGPGGLPAWVLVELFAQTAALIGGHRARLAGGVAAQGYLLGTRRFTASAPTVPLGATLRLEARGEMSEATGMGSYRCHTVGGDLAAECVLSVYTPPRDGPAEGAPLG